MSGSGRRRVPNKQEYQNAKQKIESLRKLILDGLESLDTEYENIEEELAKIKISPDCSDADADQEAGVVVPEKTTSPASSPDLVSSDSGFKTDEGTRSSGEDITASRSETMEAGADLEEEEDDTTSEATLKNEEVEDGGARKNFERFDIAFSDNGECIMQDCDLSDVPHLVYEHFLQDEDPEDEDEDGDCGDSAGATSAMLELERYFQQPRRWDMFDIDEVFIITIIIIIIMIMNTNY